MEDGSDRMGEGGETVRALDMQTPMYTQFTPDYWETYSRQDALPSGETTDLISGLRAGLKSGLRALNWLLTFGC